MKLGNSVPKGIFSAFKIGSVILAGILLLPICAIASEDCPSGVAANVHGVCHWLVIMGRYKSRDQALKAASKISTNSNHQLNFLNDQECDFKKRDLTGLCIADTRWLEGLPWGFWIVVAADTESETQAKDQLKELKKFTPGAYVKDGFEIQDD